MKEVLVIGGGIIGQFTAYCLVQSGFKITILDDHPKMPPASSGNCGLVTPSHIAPLNSLTTLIEGLKSLSKKDAPLYIKPQLDFRFIKWFLSFVWHSHSSSVKKATEARNQLLQKSWALYSDFFKQEENSSEWRTEGLIYASIAQRSFRKLEKEVGFLNQHRLESRILSRDDLLALEPSLTDKVVGGAIFNIDGWLNPTQLLSDIKKINRSNGVHFIDARVDGFCSNSKSIKSAKSMDQSFDADEFVLCSGAQTVALAEKLGISLPIIPGKGYNLTTSVKIDGQPKNPVYMYERKVVATPWKAGLRLGSTVEFAGFDLSLNKTRLNALKNAAGEYLKTDLSQSEFEPWAGWRPMTPHGMPIIKKHGKFSNLTIATGHGMLGLSMAPATGMVVKELMADD